MGSALQQGEVLATPGSIGFASIAKAFFILNDEARMSNDERITSPVIVLQLLIAYSSKITSMSTNRKSLSDFLPTLPGIAYRRQALAKLRLLTFSFFLPRCITCLLLRARPLGGTTGEYNNKRRAEKHGGYQLFHRESNDNQADWCGNFGSGVIP